MQGLMNDIEGIRTIFFDYGGTLDAPGTAWRDRFYPLYLQAGLHIEPDVFAKAFYTSDDSLVAENPVHMNLTEVVNEQVKRVLKHLGVFDKGVLDKIASAFLSSSFSQIEKNRPILERLKGRYKLGIISNNYGNLEQICVETGLAGLMDVLVDSNHVGCMKPDPRIFRAGLSALGMEPAMAVMVGDSLPRDVVGAEALGMMPIWLRGMTLQKTTRAQEISCLIITDLKELTAIFCDKV